MPIVCLQQSGAKKFTLNRTVFKKRNTFENMDKLSTGRKTIFVADVDKEERQEIMMKTLFLIGAAGFIGSATVSEALQKGWQVKALVHSVESATRLQKIGAKPLVGDVRQPDTWIAEVQDTDVFIDLVQPKLPARLNLKAIQAISAERQAMTRGILQALQTLPVERRPLFFSVSGADDLQPLQGVVSHLSPVRTQLRGFAHIGIPVRHLVETSNLDATYLYMGSMVYGPGKVFAERYVTELKKGTARIVGNGNNHLPLTHVTDAARAMVHLAGLPRAELIGRTFVVMDGADATQRALLDETADCLGVKHPGTVPTWLAALVAGSINVETITLDVHADPSALLATDFQFLYPSYREGVPTTVKNLEQVS